MLHRKISLYLMLSCLCALTACSGAKAKRAELQRQKLLQQQARKHYILGVDDYTNDRYEAAISEWKQSLALIPNYENAQDYIVRAQHMEKAIKKLKKQAQKIPLASQPSPVAK